MARGGRDWPGPYNNSDNSNKPSCFVCCLQDLGISVREGAQRAARSGREWVAAHPFLAAAAAAALYPLWLALYMVIAGEEGGSAWVGKRLPYLPLCLSLSLSQPPPAWSA